MERRQFERYTVTLPVSFSGNGLAGSGQTSGLSIRGCTVVSDDSLQQGFSIALHIQLAEQTPPLQVDLANVRWAKGGVFGLEFTRLSLQDKRRLQEFVSELERTHLRAHQQAG